MHKIKYATASLFSHSAFISVLMFSSVTLAMNNPSSNQNPLEIVKGVRVQLQLITEKIHSLNALLDNETQSNNKEETVMGVKKTYVSADQMQIMCMALYKQAITDKFIPDLLVALARGGSGPLYYLAGEPMFNNKNVRTLAVGSYDEEGKQSEVRLLQPFHIEDYKGFERILVIDDLADTGKSFKFGLQLLNDGLKNERPVPLIKTAALFYKKHSEIIPDYWVKKTADWVVFPSEVYKQ